MERFVKIAANCYHWCLDLFIPPQCVVCQRVETWLCETCAQQLTLFQGAYCLRCGRPWQGDGLCDYCRSNPLHVAPIRSAFIFEGPIQQAVHALKYRGGRAVVHPLAVRMAEAWRYANIRSDWLVPVPLYSRREARRGYNQAALLAIALGGQINMPVVPNLLSRTRNTRSQTKLNRQERRKNVSKAFSCVESVDLSGKRITLVDDVATTGSTLDACALALLEHGAEAVSAFTLAHAA